jgi:hypothetical protein
MVRTIVGTLCVAIIGALLLSVVVSPFVTTKAYANKMDGKRGGYNPTTGKWYGPRNAGNQKSKPSGR